RAGEFAGYKNENPNPLVGPGRMGGSESVRSAHSRLDGRAARIARPAHTHGHVSRPALSWVRHGRQYLGSLRAVSIAESRRSFLRGCSWRSMPSMTADHAGAYVNRITSWATRSLATRRRRGRGPAKNGLPRPRTTG